MTLPAWDVLVPLKALQRAKSRLVPIGPLHRRELARAMALDTVSAVAGAPVRVHVMCDDPVLGAAVEALQAGVQVHRGGPAGLNGALAHGASRLGLPAPGRPVAVVLADLPALRGHDLAELLTRALELPRAVVADRAGTGTTVLCATGNQPLAPGFGPGSLRRHVDEGAVVLDAAPGLRRDVDVLADLDEVAGLDLGPRTRSLLDSWSQSGPETARWRLDVLRPAMTI